jgi:hypothetical protein
VNIFEDENELKISESYGNFQANQEKEARSFNLDSVSIPKELVVSFVEIYQPPMQTPLLEQIPKNMPPNVAETLRFFCQDSFSVKFNHYRSTLSNFIIPSIQFNIPGFFSSLKGYKNPNPFTSSNLGENNDLVPAINQKYFDDNFYCLTSQNSDKNFENFTAKRICGLMDPTFIPPGLFTKYTTLSQSHSRKQWRRLMQKKYNVQIRPSHLHPIVGDKFVTVDFLENPSLLFVDIQKLEFLNSVPNLEPIFITMALYSIPSTSESTVQGLSPSLSSPVLGRSHSSLRVVNMQSPSLSHTVGSVSVNSSSSLNNRMKLSEDIHLNLNEDGVNCNCGVYVTKDSLSNSSRILFKLKSAFKVRNDYYGNQNQGNTNQVNASGSKDLYFGYPTSSTVNLQEEDEDDAAGYYFNGHDSKLGGRFVIFRVILFFILLKR